MLLIHGARCASNYVDGKNDKKKRWAAEKKQRIGFNKAAEALANKHARIIWAMRSFSDLFFTNHSRGSGELVKGEPGGLIAARSRISTYFGYTLKS